MKKSKNYELLKKIINQEDPIGLIDLNIHESLNEYGPEIEEILKKDVTRLNNEELSLWIFQVFVSFFNEDLAGGKHKYDLIAKEFISALKKLK